MENLNVASALDLGAERMTDTKVYQRRYRLLCALRLAGLVSTRNEADARAVAGARQGGELVFMDARVWQSGNRWRVMVE